MKTLASMSWMERIPGRYPKGGAWYRRCIVLGLSISIGIHLAAWAQPADNAPYSLNVIRASTEFRILAGKDFRAAAAAFDAHEVLPFIFRKPLTEIRAHAWSSFFANSVLLMGHLDSEHIVVGYYHPLYDTILLTVWTESGEGSRLIDSDLRRTSAPGWRDTSDTFSAAPAWMERSRLEPVQAVLRQSFAEALAKFEKQYPPRASSMPVVRPSTHADDVAVWMEQHATAIIRSVRATVSERGPLFNRSLHAVREALRAGDQSALNHLLPSDAKPSTRQLILIPGTSWERLVPVYALLGKTDSMVILQDPLRPTVNLLLFFKHFSDWNRPVVSSCSLFVLESLSTEDGS